MRLSKIVSSVILSKEGKFTKRDIELDLLSKGVEVNENYLKYKLDSMCELGLIGRTSVYYFSV